jgi:pimeloyl-ACP methyl ester carboxylesterase
MVPKVFRGANLLGRARKGGDAPSNVVPDGARSDRTLSRRISSGRTGAVFVALAVAVIGVAAQLVPVAPAAQPAAAASTIDWRPCQGGFQCADVSVPLDYGAPSGPRISLAVIRLPAGDPKHRIGSLFVNPGGPGGSGVEVVRGIGRTLPVEMRGRFDIVGFDPRGILASTPLRCFATFDEAFNVVSPFAFPYTHAEEEVVRGNDRKLADACAAHGGAIRDHMSTADVARDVDFMRAAMGDQKLNFLGFSYGTVIGQTYANMFPRRVRSIVIDGVVDPVAWSKGAGHEGRTLPMTTRLRSDKGAQATLGQFFRLCDKAGKDNCAFAPHSARRFAALAAKLRHAPIVIGTPPDTFQITYADVISTALGSMYSADVWPLFAGFLADTEQQASPAVVSAKLVELRKRLGVDQPAQEEYPNYIEGFPSVVCSDSVNPTSFEAWPRAAAAADAHNGYFGRPWTWAGSPCAAWPATAGQDRYLGPWTRRTSSPVLVVGNYFDPATRYQGAVKASQLLPNSRLLTYAGWGHTAFFGGNYCIDAAVMRYFVRKQLPAKGTVCKPTFSPFEPMGALAEQRASMFSKIGLPMMPESVRQGMSPDRR